MSRESKVMLLTNVFSSLFYTLLLGPLAGLIVTGSFEPYSAIEWIFMYLLGWAMSSMIPFDLAKIIQRKLFPRSIGTKRENLVATVIYAAIYEFLYGIGLNIWYYHRGNIPFDGKALLKETLAFFPASLVLSVVISIIALPWCSKWASAVFPEEPEPET